MFTQPLMYQKIKEMLPISTKYQNQILSEGIVDEQYIKVCENLFIYFTFVF